MHYRLFVFVAPNNKLMYTSAASQDSEFCNYEFIKSKFLEGYDNIFVAKKDEFGFKGDSEKVILVKKKFIDGDSGDLYDHFKRFIGRRSKPVIHLYQFKLRRGEDEA